VFAASFLRRYQHLRLAWFKQKPETNFGGKYRRIEVLHIVLMKFDAENALGPSILSIG
jgi:hypothetical protein